MLVRVWLGGLLAVACLAACSSHAAPVASGGQSPAASAPSSGTAAQAGGSAAPTTSATGGAAGTLAPIPGAPTAAGTTGTTSGSPAAGATRTALPTLPAYGTATPAYHPSGTTDAAESHDATQLVADSYDAWMTDLSGLYDNLSSPWVDAIGEIATPQMKQAAYGSANAVVQANEHGIGTLVDSHRQITFNNTKTVAIIEDCLDELHWYLVNNSSGKPDPGVTRGYYEGDAKLALEKGQWLVSAWNSHPTKCTP